LDTPIGVHSLEKNFKNKQGPALIFSWISIMIKANREQGDLMNKDIAFQASALLD
jgi:hypothetical protein